MPGPGQCLNGKLSENLMNTTLGSMMKLRVICSTYWAMLEKACGKKEKGKAALLSCPGQNGPGKIWKLHQGIPQPPSRRYDLSTHEEKAPCSLII